MGRTSQFVTTKRLNKHLHVHVKSTLKLLKLNVFQQNLKKVFAAGVGGTKRALSTARTGLEALFSPEEAARKGVERAEELGQQYAPGASLEAVKQAYADRGLMGGAGEAISQIPTALAEQFPQIAATLGGARAGAAAGARFGAKGALIGGIGGAVAPSLAQLFGANIERQAAEQMEEGKPLRYFSYPCRSSRCPRCSS
jgi:hypothetical protein